MTIPRIAFLMLVTASTLILVVALRAETTRLNYAISRLDAEAIELRRRAASCELEIARLRNPLALERIAERLSAVAEEHVTSGDAEPPR
ncbi:MAG: hypothetical protein KDA32_07340 [Phycisphaerales bacterium]|nr:hypothetical protein [Phycisphaerales bacterium]